MSCAKIRFVSRAEAVKYLRSVRNVPHKLYAYECPHCGSWHLSSQQQRRRKRELRRASKRS